jgi:hypothetical protein
MAYKYFSQKLVGSGFDLSSVFPEKQSSVKQIQNVNYGLGDIVIYLQDVTKNFKSQDSSYIDLDNAIQEIISRYYKSLGEQNPFLSKEEKIDTFEQGVVPTPAITVKDGTTQTAEVVIPVKQVKEEEIKEIIESKESELTKKIDNFKKTLDGAEFLLEDSDEEGKKEILDTFRKRLVGIELLMEGEAEVDEFDLVRKQLLSDFIKKHS